jgi:hypothetical protein
VTAAIPIIVDLGAEAGAEMGAEMGAEESASDIPGGTQDLGNGHRMQFSSEQFRQLLHSEEVVRAITERADGVTKECNDTKIKKRAVYVTLVQNESWTTRARAFTKPGNADAAYDDAKYSTMLKAAANAPNDPKLGGDGQSAPDGSDSAGEDAAAGEEAEAAEAGEAAEMADVAEIALIAL